MRNFETIEDVIYFAIESEIQSVEFYNRLADAATDGPIQELFSRLMEDEKWHIVRLQYLLDHQQELEVGPLSHTYLEEEYSPRVTPSAQVSVEEGLLIAIQKEKAAVRLYTDLATESQKHQVRDTFLFLAGEEEKHQMKSEKEFQALKSSK